MRANLRPAAEPFRIPTMPTAGPASRAASPSTESAGGGSGIAASAAG